MPVRKVVVALLIIFVAIGGFIAGLYLLQQRQELRERAAVETGQATVNVTPVDGNYNVGENIVSTINFNTDGIAIAGIQVRLMYNYSETQPPVSVTSIELEPDFSTGDWSCPTKVATAQGGQVIIDIACGTTSQSGYSTLVDVPFATFTMNVGGVPQVNPVVLNFDPANTVIADLDDNDILLTPPVPAATYTIAGDTQPSVTPSPTATGVPPSGTPSPSPTATSGPSSTPTPTGQATATATPTTRLTTTPSPTSAQLPDAGTSYPTVIGIGVGILVLLGSLLLAL